MHRPEQWITGVRHNFSRLGGGKRVARWCNGCPPPRVNFELFGEEVGGGRVQRSCRTRLSQPSSNAPLPQANSEVLGGKRGAAGAGPGAAVVSQAVVLLSPNAPILYDNWQASCGVGLAVWPLWWQRLRAPALLQEGVQGSSDASGGGWRWCDVACLSYAFPPAPCATRL